MIECEYYIVGHLSDVAKCTEQATLFYCTVSDHRVELWSRCFMHPLDSLFPNTVSSVEALTEEEYVNLLLVEDIMAS